MRPIYFLELALLAASLPPALAQAPAQIPVQVSLQVQAQTAALTLPDSPGAIRSSESSTEVASSSSAQPSPTTASAAQPASRLTKVIEPGQQAPTLTARNKLELGAKSAIAPMSIASWFVSAGWSHLTNGAPNYGTDKGAFGERLGAAGIRDPSEEILSTGILAATFHEDPRYYKLGRGHSIGRRIVYAATRVLVTKTDHGKATPNLALLGGNLAGAALTNAYYPPLNHGVSQTMMIFGSSLGGSAIGFGIDEFLEDALVLAHLKKNE